MGRKMAVEQLLRILETFNGVTFLFFLDLLLFFDLLLLGTSDLQTLSRAAKARVPTVFLS